MSLPNIRPIAQPRGDDHQAQSPFFIATVMLALSALIICMASGCGDSAPQSFSNSAQPGEACITQTGTTQTGTIVVKLPELSRASHTVDNNTVEFTGYDAAGMLVYGPRKEPRGAPSAWRSGPLCIRR